MNNKLQATTYPAAGGLPGEKVTTSYTQLGNPNGVFRGAYAYVDSVTYTHLNETAQIAQTSLNHAQYHSYYFQDGTRRLDRALVTSNTATLADRNYTYTPSGNITAIKDNADAVVGGADAQCFSYDYAQRLTEAWTPANADCAAAPSATGLGGPAPYWTSYTYDVAGNRTSTTNHTSSGDTTGTYAYPAASTAQPHTLQSVTTGTQADTYEYDAAGNTTETTINGVTRTYTIGADGHVSSIETGSTTTQQNVYDTNGQLLLRTENGETTVYLGSTQATLHADGKLSADRTITLGEQPIAVRSNTPGSTASSVTWLSADTQGTATITQNPTTGQTVKRYYDPFGITRGAPAPEWPTDNALLDRPQSSTTGHSRLGIRDYDPSTGRFTSRDLVIDGNDPQQLNGYNYANNNPVLYSDPSGAIPGFGILVGLMRAVNYQTAYRDKIKTRQRNVAAQRAARAGHSKLISSHKAAKSTRPGAQQKLASTKTKLYTQSSSIKSKLSSATAKIKQGIIDDRQATNAGLGMLYGCALGFFVGGPWGCAAGAGIAGGASGVASGQGGLSGSSEWGKYYDQRGAAAEAIIAEALGIPNENVGVKVVGDPKFTGTTNSANERHVDMITEDGIAIEVKVGKAYAKENGKIDNQVIKDIQLIGQQTASGQTIQGVLWVFVISEAGKGPSPTTLAMLEEYGLDYAIVGGT